MMNLREKWAEARAIFKHRAMLRRVARSYVFFLGNEEKSMWGSITKADEEGLRRAVEASKNFDGPIVEIGALFGHTTNLLASLKRADARLIAVDNFSWNPFELPRDAHREFTRRTLRYVMDHCQVEIFDGEAAAFYEANRKLTPSLVFIDAGHDYHSVRSDIAWAVASGCPVISGHDYIDIHPGVVRAVDEAFGSRISVYGSVWISESSAKT